LNNAARHRQRQRAKVLQTYGGDTTEAKLLGDSLPPLYEKKHEFVRRNAFTDDGSTAAVFRVTQD